MSKHLNIAIIGGGMFGVTISLALEKKGVNVTLFERNKDIILGTSLNNQNRLHLGFHYPRSLETARQCKSGFERFVHEYPECVPEKKFNNMYFIAMNNSLVTQDEYVKFCDELGADYEVKDESSYPVTVENVAMGISCNENVYDANKLRQVLKDKLKKSSINMRLGANVHTAKWQREKINIETEFSEETFDAVVNCSYANINRLTNQLGFDVKQNQYEYTVIPIIKLDIPRVGITIMDGRFMTLLPYGNSDLFLLYHVDYSVFERIDTKQLDENWLDKSTSPFASVDGEGYFQKFVAECAKYIPCLEDAELVDYLEGPRMVLAKKEDTDERPSILNIHDKKYLTVFSGKIDHCFQVADDVAEHFFGDKVSN